MATYKEIKGTQIEVLASDPSNPVEGQVWYNSTSNVLKGLVATGSAAWATGNALNTARSSMSGQHTGTQTAALAYGGYGASSDHLNVTEQYNGTNWTEVNNLNTPRRNTGGAGADSTSGLVFGGSPGTQALTETWNGSNWTEANDLNTARYALGGAGVIGSALAFGGTTPVKANTEDWNGASWVEVADLNAAKESQASGGTTTSAFSSFGYTTTSVATAEEWSSSSTTTKTVSTE